MLNLSSSKCSKDARLRNKIFNKNVLTIKLQRSNESINLELDI